MDSRGAAPPRRAAHDPRTPAAERPLAVAVGDDPRTVAQLEAAARGRSFRWGQVPGLHELRAVGQKPDVAFLLDCETLAQPDQLHRWPRETVLVVDPEHMPRVLEIWQSLPCHALTRPLEPRFLARVLDDVDAEFRQRLRYRALPEGGALPLDRLGRLHGSAPIMQRLHRRLAAIAPGDATVFIYGERGTGKSVAARALHDVSGRAARPFVQVECAGHAWKLAERRPRAEAAGDDWRERLERARGGTLFLNELCGMPLQDQYRLLRTLERTLRGEAPVRLVAASARDPVAALRERRLSPELYRMLGQFVVRLPALRERGDDVIGLSRLFVDRLNAAAATRKTLSWQATQMLRRYPWPGNTAELKRALEQAHAAATGSIHPMHLPASVRAYDLLVRGQGERPDGAATSSS